MIEAIDAHHHFWDPSRGDYSWMTDAHAPIRQIFAPDDLRPSLADAGVSRTVLVQTWSSREETENFLSLAERTDFIAGVVGWVDLTASDVGDSLDRLMWGQGGRYLVGIRHQVHDEPDPDWLCRDDVRSGLQAVADRDLAYDLLIRPREIPASLDTVQAFPDLRFVIDHIAKPEIAAGGFATWAEAMAPFSGHRSHVWCKLSGMVTEADWDSIDDAQFLPYVEEVLRLFGPEHAMYGSDWPVCLLAGEYGRTLGFLRRAIESRPQAEQRAILHGNAIEAYRLTEQTPA